MQKNTTQEKRGGKRAGAGRPHKVEDCPSVVMRVPQFMKAAVSCFIRLQADQMASERGRPVTPLTENEERERRELIGDLEVLLRYEFKRQAEHRQRERNWIDAHTPSLF